MIQININANKVCELNQGYIQDMLRTQPPHVSIEQTNFAFIGYYSFIVFTLLKPQRTPSNLLNPLKFNLN